MISLSPESLRILAAARAAAGPVRVRRLVHGLALPTRLAAIGIRELVALGLVRQLGATRRAMRLEVVPGCGTPELGISAPGGGSCPTAMADRDCDRAVGAGAVCGATSQAPESLPHPRARVPSEHPSEGAADPDHWLCVGDLLGRAGPQVGHSPPVSPAGEVS